jgi:hypothetical protein
MVYFMLMLKGGYFSQLYSFEDSCQVSLLCVSSCVTWQCIVRIVPKVSKQSFRKKIPLEKEYSYVEVGT